METALDSSATDCPDWIIEWAIARNGSQRVDKNFGPPPPWLSNRKDRGLVRRALANVGGSLLLTDICAAVQILPNDDLDWENWNWHGMLFYAVSDGMALEAWHQFSQKSKKYDPAETDKRWLAYRKSPPTRLGIGSLIFKVRQVQANWIPPSQRNEAINDNTEPANTIAQSDEFEGNLTIRFRELAAMSAIEYDRVRNKEAERLGIRVPTLDEEVEKFRDTTEDLSRAGRALELPLPEPWPTPVDGAKLLEDLCHAVLRFVFMPKEAALAVALWIVHAHAFEASMVTPRLVITAPEKRCGKTTLLRVIQAMVPKAVLAANITAAAIFRTIELIRPTLLIDEGDTFLRDSEELKGVLNSGHSKDGQVVRLVGEDHEPRVFSTWSPVAIATIDWLPSTIEDRSIKIVMRRRRRDECVERFREDRIEPLTALARMARRWADDHLETLRNSDPMMPSELHDRAADNWRPLFAIADAAGGDLPGLAREAARALSDTSIAEPDSRGTMLLGDVRSAFESKNTDRLSSDALVIHLTLLDDRPWGEINKGRPLTKSRLARLLNPFKIRSTTIRLDHDTAKGYYRSDFDDAFARYLPDET